MHGIEAIFRALTGNDPFPWQQALFERFVAGSIPASCNIPTGLGKTLVIAIWLIALARRPEKIPRRLVYVVNRRTVVDQTTDEVEKLRDRLQRPQAFPEHAEALRHVGADLRNLTANNDDVPLAISTLRGQFADNREWASDPSRAAVICGTVDMIGSRLLFSGYGVGFKGKPLHAGFLGQDALIVHDEAHLEPAFQDLLAAIEKEQTQGRFKDRFPLKVLELSATSRDANGRTDSQLLALTDADRSHPLVNRRINATKRLHLVPQADGKIGLQLAKLAIDKFKDSGRAVLIFTRTIDDVRAITEALDKARLSFEQLIGPMRGLERERLLQTNVFKRFLAKPEGGEGTVFLVCTSAGEVGVNISADHLVCDLSTFESMAQRFGRVNRFGLRDDSEIHVVYPTKFEDKSSDPEREKTLKLLERLHRNASPDALSKLPEADRIAAFAPPPTTLPTSDILFDAWALTSIRDQMPGRPRVEAYLHGIRDYERPETQIAWREEVAVITGDLLYEYAPQDLLDEYPIKPHELLGDRSDRVHKELVKLAERYPNTPTWVIDESGKVTPTPLDIIAEKTGKELIERKTILLPHHVGGLTKQGLLDGFYPPPVKRDKPPVVINNDVADAWNNEQDLPLRLRVWDDDPDFDTKTEGLRLILRIDFPSPEDDEHKKQPSWHWFERPIPKENSKNAAKPVLLDVHVSDVINRAKDILSRLTLDPDPQHDAKFKHAILTAAQLHDLGKKRELWQRSVGRPLKYGNEPVKWFGKSGRRWRPRDFAEYRHEFGSLVDLQNEEVLKSLDDDSKDLVQHLIATHHGQGRPHFTSAQTVDPNSTTPVCDAIAIDVPRRYARLQRKFGRWGLAYIESLLRAADYAASAEPSAYFTEDTK
jgi:CRISPR-associated endonuclease/helicase Cas3